MSDSVQPHRRLPRPWDSPGKNTGVGCHFLLQCMKVKSESEVAQSCPTLSDPTDCSLPGSSVHGIFQAGVLEWGAIAFSKSCSVMSNSATPTIQPVEFSRPENLSSLSLLQGIFPTQGLNPGLPTLQADSLPAEPQGKPKNTGVGSLSLLQQIFPT